MQNVNILICDDDPIVHESLKIYLKNEGFNCSSAYDGEEALEQIKHVMPTLIVLDIMMPKLNGLEVCKEVETLYILASNRGQVFSREQILKLVWGYDYYGDTRTIDGVGYKFEVE